MSLRKSRQCPHMSVVMSCNMFICTYVIHISGWLFQKLLFFHIWDNPSHWLIFFKLGWNQPVYIYVCVPLLYLYPIAIYTYIYISHCYIYIPLGYIYRYNYIYISHSISHCYSILPLWHFQAGRRLQEPMLKSRAMQRHQHHRRMPDGRCMSGTVLWSRGVHGKYIEFISWL